MGSIWLHALPDWLAAAGLNVDTYPGWELRSRSSGGYDAILGVGIHHDAWPEGSALQNRVNYEYAGHRHAPIGAMHLHTDGRVIVGAAGATNTQGRGGPYPVSRGVIPQDQGNRYMVSIEASNNGTGERWPEAQQDAYVLLCATLCDRLGLVPRTDVIAHFEWAPTRKIDPWGPSRWAGMDKWDMEAFRQDVASTSPGGIMSDRFEFRRRRLLDTRGPQDNYDAYKVGAGHTVWVATPEPAAVGVMVAVTVVDPEAPGYITVWGSGARPDTGFNNYATGAALPPASQTTVVPLHDGAFQLFTKARAHVVVDMLGLYW